MVLAKLCQLWWEADASIELDILCTPERHCQHVSCASSMYAAAQKRQSLLVGALPKGS